MQNAILNLIDDLDRGEFGVGAFDDLDDDALDFGGIEEAADEAIALELAMASMAAIDRRSQCQ